MGKLLRAARRAGDALRNATTQFAASADTERADDGLRIPRAMNLPSRGRRVNISNASPLWVSEIDLNNVPFRPRRPAAGKPMSRCGPSRRVQRLTTSVAIGEERTWLDLPLVPPGRE